MISMTRHLWIVFAAIIAAAVVIDSRMDARQVLRGKPVYLVCTEIDWSSRPISRRIGA